MGAALSTAGISIGAAAYAVAAPDGSGSPGERVSVVRPRPATVAAAVRPSATEPDVASAPSASAKFSALACRHPARPPLTPWGDWDFTGADVDRSCPLLGSGVVSFYIAPARRPGSICLLAVPGRQAQGFDNVRPVTCRALAAARRAGIVSVGWRGVDGSIPVAALLPDGYTTMSYPGGEAQPIRRNFAAALLPAESPVVFTGPGVPTITSDGAVTHPLPVPTYEPGPRLHRVTLAAAARARIDDVGGAEPSIRPRRGPLGPTVVLQATSGQTIVYGTYTSVSGRWCNFSYLSASAATLVPLVGVGRSCTGLTAPPKTFYWSFDSGTVNQGVQWASGVAPGSATSVQITTSRDAMSRQKVSRLSGGLFIVEVGAGAPAYIEVFAGSHRIMTIGSEPTAKKHQPLKPNVSP